MKDRLIQEFIIEEEREHVTGLLDLMAHRPAGEYVAKFFLDFITNPMTKPAEVVKVRFTASNRLWDDAVKAILVSYEPVDGRED